MFSYVPSNCAQQLFPSKRFDSEHNVPRDSIPPSQKTGLETIETEKDKIPEIQGFFVSARGAISVLTRDSESSLWQVVDSFLIVVRNTITNGFEIWPLPLEVEYPGFRTIRLVSVTVLDSSQCCR